MKKKKRTFKQPKLCQLSTLSLAVSLLCCKKKIVEHIKIHWWLYYEHINLKYNRVYLDASEP
jgi:hypothetical protein